MNRPRTHFLLTGGEVRVQAEEVISGVDEAIESGALEAERRQEFLLLLRRKFREFRFDAGGERHDVGHFVAGGDGGAQRVDVRAVAGREFVVCHVGGVQHRLDREQHQRLEQVQLPLRETGTTHRHTVLQRRERFLQCREFGHRVLVATLRDALLLVEAFLDAADVREAQLVVDHVAITHRIDTAHHVGDVVVIEAADDVHDRIGFADVGEKLVAEAFTLRCALHQTGDVHELHHGGHSAFGLHHHRQCSEARIRNFDHADVRLDGAERIVRGLGLGSGEGVEQRGLADVRETDDAELQHEMDRRKEMRFTAPITRPAVD